MGAGEDKTIRPCEGTVVIAVGVRVTLVWILMGVFAYLLSSWKGIPLPRSPLLNMMDSSLSC